MRIRTLICSVVVGLAIGPVPVLGSDPGPSFRVPLERGLGVLDHIARQSFSAGFSRSKTIDTTVFLKLREVLVQIPSHAWSEDRWVQEPSGCGALVMEHAPRNRTWKLHREGCQQPRLTNTVEIKQQGSELLLSLPLDSWRASLTMGQRAVGQTTFCGISLKEASIVKMDCKQVALASPEGEEVFLDSMRYDQGASNVVQASGKLFGLEGITEELELKAPSRSAKMYVHLIQRIPAPVPDETIAEEEALAEEDEEMLAEEEQETVPKTEEELMAELEGLAEDWDEWKIQEAVYEKPDGKIAPTDAEEAYLDQDLVEEYVAEDKEWNRTNEDQLAHDEEQEEFYDEDEASYDDHEVGYAAEEHPEEHRSSEPYQ